MKGFIHTTLESFRRLNMPVKIFFFFSIIFLVVYETVLTQIPAPSEIFYKIGRIGVVFSQFLYAFVTGFTFYFIIEHLNLERKRVAIMRLLNNNVHEIAEVVEVLINEICITDNSIKNNEQINFKRFGPICSKINIHSAQIESWFWSRITYREYIIRMCIHIKEHSGIILSFYDLLDDDWTASLSNLDDSINFLKKVLELNGDNSTLNLCAGRIWDAYKEAKKLRELNGKLYRQYDKQYKKKFPPGSFMPQDLTFEVKKGK